MVLSKSADCFPQQCFLIIISDMLQRLMRVFTKPIVPLLIINSGLDQERSVNLLRKLRKVDYVNAKAIGVVVEIDNHMPVQIDKIAEFLAAVRKEHAIKIYGFCHSHVSAEAYYLLSFADRLFAKTSTVFELASGPRLHSGEGVMKALGVSKLVAKSHQDLIGTGLDNFSSPKQSKYFNQKLTEINQRLHEFSVANRQTINPSLRFQGGPPSTMLGEEAITRGYVDQKGNYFEILKGLYPECQLRHVRIREKISTRTLELLIASPIIIVLFLLKVLLKYTVLMWLWMRHRKEKSDNM